MENENTSDTNIVVQTLNRTAAAIAVVTVGTLAIGAVRRKFARTPETTEAK